MASTCLSNGNGINASEAKAVRKNCFDLLSDELICCVLSNLPPLDILRCVSRSCKRFNANIKRDAFWSKSMPSSGKLSRKGRFPTDLTTYQLQQYAIYDSSVCLNDKHILNILDYGSVLPSQNETRRMKQNGRYTCAASTTDRPTEGIENVLFEPRAENAPRLFQLLFHSSWWSSKSTPEPDTRSETLLFVTRYPTCVLTEVLVKPLLDPYMGHVVYSAKHMIIRAYVLPNDNDNKLSYDIPCTFRSPVPEGESGRSMDQQSLVDGNAINNLLANETPVYQGSWPVLNPFSDDAITCKLPTEGVVANVLTVELIGKHVQQTPSSGYYACVKTLDCKGFPLYLSRS